MNKGNFVLGALMLTAVIMAMVAGTWYHVDKSIFWIWFGSALFIQLAAWHNIPDLE